MRVPRSWAASLRSLVTWSASSRVGATTSACGLSGLADEVGAEERDAERHLLDREGSGDPAALEGGGDLGEHPEVSEGCQGPAFVRDAPLPDREALQGKTALVVWPHPI